MADDEDEKEEQPSKKKKIIKLAVIGLLAVIVLGGGGWFAYVKFLAPEGTPLIPFIGGGEEEAGRRREILLYVSEKGELIRTQMDLGDHRKVRLQDVQEGAGKE